MKRRYTLLYRLGLMPWDSPAIPTQVSRLDLAPGQALDLGCGTGTQAIYLAAQGWHVTAVDYVPEAIARARRRPGADAVTWIVADVTDPPLHHLDHSVTLILDNGCLHGIPPHRRSAWAHTLTAAAADQCLLLVRAAPPGRRGPGPRGISAADLDALLAAHWNPDPAQPAADDPTWRQYQRIGAHNAASTSTR